MEPSPPNEVSATTENENWVLACSVKNKRPLVPSSEGEGGGGRNVPGVTVIHCDGRAPVQHSFKACFVHLYLLTCAWGRGGGGARASRS